MTNSMYFLARRELSLRQTLYRRLITRKSKRQLEGIGKSAGDEGLFMGVRSWVIAKY